MEIHIDTHKIYEILIESDFPEKQAKAILELVRMDKESEMITFTTKEEIKALEAALKIDINNVAFELKRLDNDLNGDISNIRADISNTRADINNVRADIKNIKSDILSKLIPIIIGQGIFIIAILSIIIKITEK